MNLLKIPLKALRSELLEQNPSFVALVGSAGRSCGDTRNGIAPPNRPERGRAVTTTTRPRKTDEERAAEVLQRAYMDH